MWTRPVGPRWLGSVIGPVFVAWSVWNWVLGHLDAERVAPLLFTVPITSGVAATLLLDEQIAVGQVFGTALVVAGLLLNRRATRAPATADFLRRSPTPTPGRLSRGALIPHSASHRPSARSTESSYASAQGRGCSEPPANHGRNTDGSEPT